MCILMVLKNKSAFLPIFGHGEIMTFMELPLTISSPMGIEQQ